MKKKNQRTRILDYIAEHGSITSADASDMKPKIISLQKRLSELREEGYSLPHNHEENENTGVWYNRYFFTVEDKAKYMDEYKENEEGDRIA